MIYSMMIGPYVVEANISKLNEDDCEITIKNVMLFNINSMDYVEVERSPKQVEWFERKVASRLFEQFV
jgi:hypothetical protein